ncbi:MAG: HEAT repeat domain-containing protein [Deltaproteobacteria bacterium]|nr:HEAT repeat domain-containing protein [Deltaproteobacteria bacterium]
MNKAPSSEEMVQTIADFIELGHVENIVSMFKQEKDYYQYTGQLIRDERFMVRMGLAVLFEELVAARPQDVLLAVPSLLPVLQEEKPYLRGDAATLLGIIGTEEAREQIRKLLNDPDAQVKEIAEDILRG